MERITDEKGALQPAYLEHACDSSHRCAGCPAFAFYEDRAVGHSVFPGIASSDSCFTRCITRAGSSRQNQE